MIDRAGAAPLMPEEVSMAISDKPWGQVNQSDYADAKAFCSACLIDLNAGSDKAKGQCKLPVREPGGSVNRNAVHAAAAALVGARGGVDAPPAAKKAAARKLVALYGQLKETPPDSLERLARS